MTNENSTKILNNVLETLIDSAEGYEKAAEVADRDTFKQFFTRRAISRRAMAASVRNEIVGLGGKPEADGTILASAHRVFMKLSAAVQDNDEAAIEAVDTGEEHLRKKMDDAMENDDLLAAGKAVLGKFLGELRADGRLIDHLEETT
ncbi:ferritin-like domain-containing protein [Parasphingorhabdus halotolerans]|uniref:PA2169 family four-helix-bundle protein n=1 Tax=Parasphingorhabdus halotolerans TaxID=2725558 RepID=A0A6H2DNP4_9SPHN|nr:PA2169 family four-helix-bundle protein [Parasphingorhabdus halotolerans]QJB70279.1 PA2169 family four-helix-bundle protein [Parasphingorhabdus halotolerans]